jgi:segregation and condensation protein A
MYQIQVEKFQGPLDLLLQLIEREELDITEVSLTKVCDQYIAHLEKLPEMPPEELADFLVVAAKLLFIKSRNLLPLLVWGEEEEGGDLEARLRMYKEYVEATKKVNAILLERNHTFVREKPPISALGFAPPKDLTTARMAELFRDVLRRLIPIVKPPEALIEKTISIHDKIRHIHEMLQKHERVSFHRILEGAENRSEIIVSFLALLELVKQRHVVAKQSDHFGEIHFEKLVADATHLTLDT